MRVVSARENSETQKTLQILSENTRESYETQKTLQIPNGNTKFECQGKLRTIKSITDPQWKCEFLVPWEAPKQRKLYRSSARMRMLSAMESSATQKILQIHSEHANWDAKENSETQKKLQIHS